MVLLLLIAAAMMLGCGPGEGGEGMAANPAAGPTAVGGVNPAPQGQAAGAATVTAPAAAVTDAIVATATMGPAAVTAPAAVGSRLMATATPMPTVAAEITLSLIQLVAPLDEPEFYCVDVPGFRDSLRTDRPLQAHTCKPGAADELFIAHQPWGGQFLMPAYGLCIEAEEGLVYTRPCTNSRAQRFTHREDLTIRTFEGDLCLAVAGGSGEPAGGRSHLRRDLGLLPCGEAAAELREWVLPGESPG